MFSKEWFEIEVVIRISGRGKIGADGMAIWYTTEGAPTQVNPYVMLIVGYKIVYILANNIRLYSGRYCADLWRSR